MTPKNVSKKRGLSTRRQVIARVNSRCAATSPSVPLERGQWRVAAQAFVELLPELDKIANPELRAMMYLGAARGQSFSGRTDQAAENQLKALALAREYKLRAQEASALHGLAHVYQNRGDTLQARAFFAEVLRIARDGDDVMEYVWALASAGIRGA